MVATIVFNQNNVVTTDGNNNKLVYSFPSSASFPNHEIAIQNINLYYSWTNVNSTSLRNNQFFYAWPSNVLQAGAGSGFVNNLRQGVPTYPSMPAGQNFTAFQVIVPDGLYEVSDLNKYIQYIFIHNGHYYVNSSGQNVYFAEFVVNPSNYSIQLNTYPVLTVAQVAAVGGTLPLAVDLLNPTVQNYGTPTNNCLALYMYNPVYANASNPTFGANDFGLLFGYAKGWGSYNQGDAFNYNKGGTVVVSPAISQSTNQSFRGSITPEIQPNPVLYIAASNIENNYANPSTIIGTITPQVSFGDLISITPPQFSWNKLLSGTYQGLRIALLGSDFRDITLLDPNITIVLALRNTKDNPAVDLLNTAAGGK